MCANTTGEQNAQPKLYFSMSRQLKLQVNEILIRRVEYTKNYTCECNIQTSQPTQILVLDFYYVPTYVYLASPMAYRVSVVTLVTYCIFKKSAPIGAWKSNFPAIHVCRAWKN